VTVDAEQAEFFDAALDVWASEDDPSSETRADFALGPMRSAGPGKAMFELIDLREPRQQWRDLVDLHRAAQQPLELLAPSPEKVAQPTVRHRGAPRRGHVGGPGRRPAGRRVTTSARGSPDDDPHEQPPALAGPSPRFSRPWRTVDEAVDARRRALDALTAGWSA
jgi:hypothetical protein